MTESTSRLVDFILVRHGETVWNVRRTYIGQADPPLSGRGWTQALRGALELRHLVHAGGEVVIVSSNLIRALQTAGFIGDIALTSSLWKELDFGTWTGKTYAQIIASNEEQHFRAWYDDPWNIAPPGGETLAMLMTRVAQGLIEAVSLLQGRIGLATIIIVTHGGPIRAVEAMLRGRPRDLETYWSCSIANGEYIHHRLSTAALIRAAYNCDGGKHQNRLGESDHK